MLRVLPAKAKRDVIPVYGVTPASLYPIRPQLFKSWIALAYERISIRETNCAIQWILSYPVNSPGGGLLPYKRLMGMCRWMGSHFHDWIDYNGVALSIELLERDRTF